MMAMHLVLPILVLMAMHLVLPILVLMAMLLARHMLTNSRISEIFIHIYLGVSYFSDFYYQSERARLGYFLRL